MKPHVKIDGIDKVVDDGRHNAFTDLVEFKGDYYLAYRSCPDGHMIYTSSEIVVRRFDGEGNWIEVARYSVPDYDVRDPHFIVNGNHLYVFSGAWLVSPGPTMLKLYDDMQNFFIYTDNGTDWSEPHRVDGAKGLYFWRGAAFEGTMYIGAKSPPAGGTGDGSERPDPSRFSSLLLSSADGFQWEKHAVVQEQYGDEFAFLFESDGRAVGIARDRRRMEAGAGIITSTPPYTDWDVKPLSINIGGPMIAKIDGHYMVSGRRMKKDEPFETVLYWMDEDLHPFMVLPSGGDNGYPGFIQTGPGSALLSYYSSHEGNPPAPGKPPSAVYIVKLTW